MGQSRVAVGGPAESSPEDAQALIPIPEPGFLSLVPPPFSIDPSS